MASALLILFLSIVPTFADADNTTDYIHHLEQKISDLETHTLASEQKQAAVLASILSKLQAQDERIQDNTDDLQNLTTNGEPTILSNGMQHVAFEARTNADTRSSLIKFNKMSFNIGGGYDAHRGTFTAPKAGIYQFWFTVYVSENHATQPNQNLLKGDVVKLIAGKARLTPSYGGYVAPVETILGTHHLDVRVIQGLHVVPLTAWEQVYVQLLSSLTVKAGSSFCGVLIG